MTPLILALIVVTAAALGTLLATAVAVLARDPARRADARRALRILHAVPRQRHRP